MLAPLYSTLLNQVLCCFHEHADTYCLLTRAIVQYRTADTFNEVRICTTSTDCCCIAVCTKVNSICCWYLVITNAANTGINSSITMQQNYRNTFSYSIITQLRCTSQCKAVLIIITVLTIYKQCVHTLQCC
jgi:hypothetical protein